MYISLNEFKIYVNLKMTLYAVVFTLVLSVLFKLTAGVDNSARYDNYRLYEVMIETEYQYNVLQILEVKSDSYISLGSRTKPNPSVTIAVAPHKFSEFADLMHINKFSHKLLELNLQSLIDKDSLQNYRDSKFGWTAYHDLHSIYKLLNDLALLHPDHVNIIEIGESYEQRKILGLKISFSSGNPGVFVEGGIHSREWISPAFVTYLANALLNSEDESVRYMAKNYDWYLVPNANPDGYVYTHERDRLWRKTRKPYGDYCIGADPNRNWDFHWNEQGTSQDPCSAVYAGAAPFSEKEMRTYAEFLFGLSGKVQVFIAFHSFSQMILFPYGHTSEHAPNNDDLLGIGWKAAQALQQRYGTKYVVGSIHDTIHAVSGSSVDYAFGVLNISVAFSYELRPPAWVSHGFELPAEQILPTCEETLDSLVAMLEETNRRGYFNTK